MTYRSFLAISLVTTALMACSSSPEESDDDSLASPPAEEHQDVEDFDVETFLRAQEERVIETFCERPFQCIDDHDEIEAPASYSLRDCREQYGFSEQDWEFLIDQDVDELMSCGEADEALSQCLQQASCEEIYFVVTGELSPEIPCEEELLAQEKACEFFHEFVD